MPPRSRVALTHCRCHSTKRVTGFYATNCGSPIECLETPMDTAKWHQVSTGSEHTCGILDEDRTVADGSVLGSQDWTLVEANQSDGVTTVTASRARVSGDPQDWPLEDFAGAPTKVIAAYGVSDALSCARCPPPSRPAATAPAPPGFARASIDASDNLLL